MLIFDHLQNFLLGPSCMQEFFLPVRPQQRACQKSIQIKIKSNHITKSYPKTIHPIQSNALQSHSKKSKTINQISKKSIKIKSNPTHVNETQSISNPNQDNNIKINMEMKTMKSKTFHVQINSSSLFRFNPYKLFLE